MCYNEHALPVIVGYYHGFHHLSKSHFHFIEYTWNGIHGINGHFSMTDPCGCDLKTVFMNIIGHVGLTPVTYLFLPHHNSSNLL